MIWYLFMILHFGPMNVLSDVSISSSPQLKYSNIGQYRIFLYSGTLSDQVASVE